MDHGTAVHCTAWTLNPSSTYDRQFIRHIVGVVLAEVEAEGHNLQQPAEQSGAGWSGSEGIDSSDKRYKSAQSGTSDNERGSERRRQRRKLNAKADGNGNMVGAEATPTARMTPRVEGGPAAGHTGTAGGGDTRTSWGPGHLRGAL